MEFHPVADDQIRTCHQLCVPFVSILGEVTVDSQILQHRGGVETPVSLLLVGIKADLNIVELTVIRAVILTGNGDRAGLDCHIGLRIADGILLHHHDGTAGIGQTGVGILEILNRILRCGTAAADGCRAVQIHHGQLARIAGHIFHLMTAVAGQRVMGFVHPCHGIAVGLHGHRDGAQGIAGHAVKADFFSGSRTGGFRHLGQALYVVKQIPLFILGAQTQLAVIDEAALRLLILERGVAQIDLGNDLFFLDVVDPQAVLFTGIAAAKAEGIVDPALIHGATLSNVDIVLHLKLVHDALGGQGDLLGRAGIGSLGGRRGQVKLGDDVGAVLGIAFDLAGLDHRILNIALGAVAGAVQVELARGVLGGIAVYKGCGPAPAGPLVTFRVGPFILGAVGKSTVGILGELVAVIVEDDDLDALCLPLTILLIDALHGAAAVEAVLCLIAVIADGNIQQRQRVAFFKLGSTEHSLIGMVGIIAAVVIGTQVKLGDPLLCGHVKQIGHTGVEALDAVVAINSRALHCLSGAVFEAHQQAFLVGLGACQGQSIAELHIAGKLREGIGIVGAVVQTQSALCIGGNGLGAFVGTADIHIAVAQGQHIPVIEGTVFGKPQNAVLNGQRGGLAIPGNTVVHIDGSDLTALERHIHIARDLTGNRRVTGPSVIDSAQIGIVGFQLDVGHTRRAITVEVQRGDLGAVDGHMGSAHIAVGAAALHEVGQHHILMEDDGGIRHMGLVVAALDIADGAADHLQTGVGNGCLILIAAHTNGNVAIGGRHDGRAVGCLENHTLAEFHGGTGIKLRTGTTVALPDGDVLKLHLRLGLKDTLFGGTYLQDGAVILAVAGSGDGDLAAVGGSRQRVGTRRGHISHQHDGAAVGQLAHSSIQIFYRLLGGQAGIVVGTCAADIDDIIRCQRGNGCQRHQRCQYQDSR